MQGDTYVCRESLATGHVPIKETRHLLNSFTFFSILAEPIKCKKRARNTCCGYTFQLYAQDKTWSDGWAGGFHHNWSSPWAVCICNDLG